MIFTELKNTSFHWKRKIWQSFIQPKISIFAWRICAHKILTAEVLFRRSLIPSPVCINSITGVVEDESHSLLNCIILKMFGVGFSDLLQVNISSITDGVQLVCWACNKNLKKIVGQIRMACILNGLWVIWNCKNAVIFKHKITTIQ